MASPNVVVLDYGSGNVRSAQRALERAGALATITADRDHALACDGLLVPGVGAFASCMHGIDEVGGDAIIRQRIDDGRPVLGICVGMQVMFDRGVEHGDTTPGLARWPGVVERLHAPVLPHMGWNTVDVPDGSELFRGVEHDRFFFVHSYGVQSWDRASSAQVTWADYGGPFIAAVEDGPLSATQFHPEKSGAAGVALLANWVRQL